MKSSSADLEERTKTAAEVLVVNERFYRAFSDGDFPAMQAVWAAEAPVTCLHPGMPLLVGRVQVLASWEQILERPPPAPMHSDQARVELFANTALVLCYERNGNGPAHLAATNLFVLEAGAWRMVHHHAGPMSRPVASQPTADLN